MSTPPLLRTGTRDAVRVDGPDAATYLQGQLSQDIAAMPVSNISSALSLLLSPQGKVVAWLRVTRIGDESFLLDVDAGYADVVVARLQRFLLRTDATIAPLSLSSLSIRPHVKRECNVMDGLTPTTNWTLPALGWPDGGCDMLGSADVVDQRRDRLIRDGIVDATDDEWTAMRINAGVPAMGAELTDDTIPAAAGIVDESVSFTKGCYVGQELVARIDSRDNRVPRRLARVASPAPLAVGDTLADADGNDIATITSAAPHDGAWVALAYVARAVDVPGPARLGDGTAVELVALPRATPIGT